MSKKEKVEQEAPVKKTDKAKTKRKSKSKGKSDEEKGFKWYVLNTYSGHEMKVVNQLNQRIKANQMEDMIKDILVPTQDKIVIAKGDKKTVKEKIFPGYVLIKMILSDDTWRIVRNTEGVTGFVGTKRKPTPLGKDEVKGIQAFTKVKQPTFESSFNVGDAVKIIAGPFADFVGTISEINKDKGQLKVLISVFGRETPVDLDFLEIKKL